MLGKSLGPYNILEPLGAGGMGEVYLAEDTRLSRKVAVKVLPEALAADAERVARLEREARVLAQLNHPNVAAIHELEKHDDRLLLIMEYAEGQTLAEVIADMRRSQSSGAPAEPPAASRKAPSSCSTARYSP